MTCVTLGPQEGLGHKLHIGPRIKGLWSDGQRMGS